MPSGQEKRNAFTKSAFTEGGNRAPRITVTLHCSHDGCPNTLSAEWDPTEWWCVHDEGLVLDGRVTVEGSEGWSMPGPTYWGEVDQPVFCPEHARDA